MELIYNLGFVVVVIVEICAIGAAIEKCLYGRAKLDFGIFMASLIFQSVGILFVFGCIAIAKMVL